MTDIRELLTREVPDPPPSDDLVDRVGVLVQRRKRRRTTAAMGVVAAVAALAVVVPSALVMPDQEIAAAGTDPALCPPRYQMPWHTGTPMPEPGPLPPITEVPVSAALCEYANGSEPVSRVVIGPGATDVVDTLNRLPEPAETSWCVGGRHDTYQVVFSFGDRDLAVHLDPRCSIVSYDGHWRGADVSGLLDQFAAAYRAEGGDYLLPSGDW